MSGWTPTLVYNMMRAIGSRADVRQRYAQDLETRRQRMEQVVALGQERGEIRADRSAQDIARAFQEFGWGTLLIWSLRGTGVFTARLRANLDLIFWGLAAGRLAPPPTKIAKKSTIRNTRLMWSHHDDHDDPKKSRQHDSPSHVP